MNNKLKILVAYHKNDWLLKDDVYTPIHVGRSIFKEKSKDGFLSVSDAEKMLSSMIGDDTGDNISNENRYFNEMTAVYWAWKNYNKLENPEFIGLSHYRRHFVFNKNKELPKERRNPESNVYWFEGTDKSYKEYIEVSNCWNLLSSYDCICTYEYNTQKQRPLKKYESLRERFEELSGINGGLYDDMLKIIKNKNPDYKYDVDDFSRRLDHHLYNMFIMRKEIFFEYCNFIFPVLFDLRERLNKYGNLRSSQMRACGYLAEYLTSIFIRHKQRMDKIRVCNLNVLMIKNIYPFEYIKSVIDEYSINKLRKLKLKIKSIFVPSVKKSDDYKNIKMRIKFVEDLKKKNFIL